MMAEISVTPSEAGVLIGGLESYRHSLTGYELEGEEAASAEREYELIQPLIDRLLPIYRGTDVGRPV